jgi:hypothetical protein
MQGPGRCSRFAELKTPLAKRLRANTVPGVERRVATPAEIECSQRVKRTQRARQMNADLLGYWGLFENRPAKERTSLPPSEAPQSTREPDRQPRRRRTSGQAVAERSKC